MNYSAFIKEQSKMKSINYIFDIMSENDPKEFTSILISAISIKIDELETVFDINNANIIKKISHLNLIKNKLEKLNELLVFS